MDQDINPGLQEDKITDVKETDRQLILRLSKHIREMKKEHFTSLSRLTKEYEEKIRQREQDFENRLRETEKLREQAIEEEAHKYRTSWTWRIGSVPVHGLLLIRNFIQNPLKFFTNRQYRLKEIKYDASPPGFNTPKQSKPVATIQTHSEFIDGNEWPIDPAKPFIGCIFDTFTQNCFKPEFNALTPSPENWNTTLEHFPVQAFIVESAWHGNNDSWLYQIGKYNNENNRLLKELVSGVKSKGIPLVFWNKEDPVHFDKFLAGAALCDYIFTTDADCIPKYIEHTGNQKVFALPFAAQEKIHNPVMDEPRDGMVCFAGTYHVNRYAERKIDMDIILKPALEFGLDIYDRQFGVAEKYADQYRFPDIYQSSIKGKLEYEEMVRAYRKYKVFLNVNSVRYSPTMFARRVFELLACGTPVISTYSKGILNILGDDTVFISETEEETRNYLGKLLGDEKYWWECSLRGIRKVLENHTYYHRTREIFDIVGIGYTEHRPVRFLIIASVHDKNEAEWLKRMLDGQLYRNFELLLLQGKEDLLNPGEQSEVTQFLGAYPVRLINPDPQQIGAALNHASGAEYTAFFDLNHYYGENYLRDYALAIRYSGAKKIGKKHSLHQSDSGKLSPRNSGYEFQYVTDVPAGSLVLEKATLTGQDILNILKEPVFYDFDLGLLSIDPYNFILQGYGAPDQLCKEMSI